MTLPAAPSSLDSRLIASLRRDLDASGWTVDGTRTFLGPVASGALDRSEIVPAIEATAGSRHPIAVLVRLFTLGLAVDRADLEAALPSVGVTGLAELGLIATGGGEAKVRAAVELSPYSASDAHGTVNWWIAADLSETARGGMALPGGYVLGVGGASRTLAEITVRTPVASALDLGTGCGIQALHLGRHAERVVATDIDERALGFARFNQVLNAPEMVLELRLGSMLEPVAGERFDLVVSNPPFVITPRGSGVTEYTYRDGGAAGDDVVAGLVASLASVLAPGGVAQMLGNWEVRGAADWTERVRGWLAGSGLDAWVVQREVQDPAEYAELWLRDGGQTADRDPQGYAAAYRAWLADFASRDVGGVGFGFVTLRRPTGAGEAWERLEEITGSVHQPLGGVIAQVLAVVEDVRGVGDPELLGRHWVVASDVTEERFFTPGEASPSVILLRAGGGFGRTVRCDTALAAFVGACDGELRGDQIIAAIAALLEVDAEALAAELGPQVRGLAIDGLLTSAP